MAEYINKDTAIAHVEEQYRLFKGDESKQSIVEGCVEALKFVPTADVVEVVRCMHCQHFKTNINKENYCDIHSTTWDKFYVRDDDYCSYGRRIRGD